MSPVDPWLQSEELGDDLYCPLFPEVESRLASQALDYREQLLIDLDLEAASAKLFSHAREAACKHGVRARHSLSKCR